MIPFLIALFVVYAAGSLVALVTIVNRMNRAAQEERQHLEDRLMALTHPVALTQVEAVRDDTPASPIRYLDEERGTSLQRAGGSYGDE